ncbi:MAG: Gas vesicle structural protein [Firmicutes bacterium]|nr:Gas vesicle structural protein [Bacillota bacterium]
MGLQPTAAKECGITDLLERILDKGLVLNLDLLISLAGVPLLGVNLRAALAGMETMLKYGVLTDWDEKTRDWARKEREKSRKGRGFLVDGEEVLVKMFGSHWYSRGIYRSWRPGHLYVTDRRVLLWRAEPAEVLMEAPYQLIKGLAMERKINIAKKETDYLYLLLKDGEVAQLHPTDASVVKEAIEKRMEALELKLEEKPTIPPVDEDAAKLLTPGEGVTRCGKMWHLMTLPSPGRTTSDQWKPGHLYLTNKRLYWYYNFDGRVAWETRHDSLDHATIQLKDQGGMLKQKQVLNVLYKNEAGNKVACFSGIPVEMKDWEDALSDVIRQRSEPLPEDWESCPQCGEKAPREKLLKEGCSVCGWISPRLRRKI